MNNIKQWLIDKAGWIVAIIVGIFSVNSLIKGQKKKTTVKKEVEAKVSVEKSKIVIDNAKAVQEENNDAIQSANKTIKDTNDLIAEIEEELNN